MPVPSALLFLRSNPEMIQIHLASFLPPCPVNTQCVNPSRTQREGTQKQAELGSLPLQGEGLSDRKADSGGEILNSNSSGGGSPSAGCKKEAAIGHEGFGFLP